MSRLSSKHQITVPVDVVRKACLAPGDELEVRAVAPGRLEVERTDDLVTRWAGSAPAGTWPPGHLERLRDEWER